MAGEETLLMSDQDFSRISTTGNGVVERRFCACAPEALHSLNEGNLICSSRVLNSPFKTIVFSFK